MRELGDCAWSEKSNFKYTVQKLLFDVTEKMFNDIVPSPADIPLNVRDFILKLCPSVGWDVDEDAITGTIVSFIRNLNNHGPNQLETISLQTRWRRLWKALYSLSNLHSLELQPSESWMMSGPMQCGIHHFLAAAPAEIHHLSLIDCSERGENIPVENRFNDVSWRDKPTNYRAFKLLTSLKIQLPVRAQQYPRMLKYLAGLAPNLEALEVQNSVCRVKSLKRCSSLSLLQSGGWKS